MEKIYENKKSEWLRPWNIEKFDNLYDRDERFFGLLTKGVLSWLTSNIVLYNKPILHFIFKLTKSRISRFSVKRLSGYNSLP